MDFWRKKMKKITVKKILTSNNGTGINAYRGCTHGCIYCDSRSTCYHTPVPFEDIEVKENAPNLLEKELSAKRKKTMIGTGSMCDPYMPIEKDLMITRKCLEIIENHGFGATVLTKSNLVLRDFDILERISKKTKAVLQMTLTTANDDICRIIEPNVCPTSEREKVLLEAKRRGIPTVVWLTPFLPFINDTEKNIDSLLETCKKASVKGIVIWNIGVTLRDGDREYFYEKLDEHFPGLRRQYEKRYGNSYNVESPKSSHLMKKIRTFSQENNIMYKTDEVFSYLMTLDEPDPFNEFDFGPPENCKS